MGQAPWFCVCLINKDNIELLDNESKNKTNHRKKIYKQNLAKKTHRPATKKHNPTKHQTTLPSSTKKLNKHINIKQK